MSLKTIITRYLSRLAGKREDVPTVPEVSSLDVTKRLAVGTPTLAAPAIPKLFTIAMDAAAKVKKDAAADEKPIEAVKAAATDKLKKKAPGTGKAKKSTTKKPTGRKK